MKRTILALAAGIVAVLVASGVFVLTSPAQQAAIYSHLPIAKGAVLDFMPGSQQPDPIVFNVSGAGGRVVGAVYASSRVNVTVGSPNATSCHFGCPPLWNTPWNESINETLAPGTYGLFFYTQATKVTVTRTIEVVYGA